MKKNIIVIGGSGFLGSHVSDSLTKSGYKVTIYDNKKSKWINKNQDFVLGDILDEEKINYHIKKSNIVFNFAGISDLAQAYYNAIEVTKYNVLGNSIILQSCVKNNILFLSITFLVLSFDSSSIHITSCKISFGISLIAFCTKFSQL